MRMVLKTAECFSEGWMDDTCCNCLLIGCRGFRCRGHRSVTCRGQGGAEPILHWSCFRIILAIHTGVSLVLTKSSKHLWLFLLFVSWNVWKQSRPLSVYPPQHRPASMPPAVWTSAPAGWRIEWDWTKPQSHLKINKKHWNPALLYLTSLNILYAKYKNLVIEVFD